MKKELPNTLFPFLWYFLRSYKPAVVIYIFLALNAGLWGPFNSMLFGRLVNLLPNTQNDVSILFWPASLIVINFIIFDNITWRGITYIRYRFLPFIICKVDNVLLDYTLRHSHQFFIDRMAGTLSKQIFYLIDGMEKIVSSTACNIFRAASLLLMVLFLSYKVHAVFFTILLLWSILFFTISILMSKNLTILSEDQASKESILGGQIIDSVTNAFTVGLFANKGHELGIRCDASNDYKKSYQKKEKYSLMMHSVQGALIAIMMAFSVFCLIELYGKDMITIGSFVLILGLSMETGHMMWYTMHEIDEFNKVAGRCKQSLDSLILPIEIMDIPNAKKLDCHNGQITFDNVKFHYRGSKALFEKKSIEIKPGQKIGLVGYSGSGKSTFVNLILRLYDVTSGAILIDGQDISKVTLDSLRSRIAMIPQDPSLFHRTIMENIRYGRINSSDEEVMEAAKKAHAHEFILALPGGYESLVGEKGVKLSGGQRQRIAIARAILKNAPILILDEATSQLDSVTENLIQESLLELMNGRNEASSSVGKTTIVIAHRLSTLLHMDRILVFDKGKIVEDGTHIELLEKSGLYSRLWNAQVGGFLGDHNINLNME